MSDRGPPARQDVALDGEPLDIGPEPTQFLQGGRVAPPREGLGAPGRGRLPPVPQRALADVAVVCALDEAPPLLGDERDGVGLELSGERPS
jgi:hypothetical protein